MAIIEFVANDLCLDLVNTEIVEHGQPVDLLLSYEHLLDWLAEANLISSSNLKILKKWKNSEEANDVFAQAKTLRASYHQLAEDLIEGKTPSPSLIKQINTLMAQDSMYPQLKQSVDRYQIDFVREIKQPIDLMPVLAALPIDLLTQKDLDLVRKCGNPACVRYFYDSTKNHKRRWCSMDGCGNLMKVQRFRQKNKT